LAGGVEHARPERSSVARADGGGLRGGRVGDDRQGRGMVHEREGRRGGDAGGRGGGGEAARRAVGDERRRGCPAVRLGRLGRLRAAADEAGACAGCAGPEREDHSRALHRPPVRIEYLRLERLAVPVN
jgi:hypothetical protein